VMIDCNRSAHPRELVCNRLEFQPGKSNQPTTKWRYGQ